MLLTREKKRASWSLLVGLLVAGTVFAWLYFHIEPASIRLPVLVADCKKKGWTAISPEEAKRLWAAKKAETTSGEPVRMPPNGTEPPVTVVSPDEWKKSFEAKGHWVPMCEPNELSDQATKGEAQDVLNAEETTLMVFLIFCVPLVWYFLLDRIRDVSAAISGRDRTP